MAEYTKRNLRNEVEDAAPRYRMSPPLEARFAREELGLAKSGVSYQRLEPDSRVPFGHRHSEQEELYVVVVGSGRMKIDDEVVELEQWDAVRVAPEAMRNLASGSNGIEVVVFGAPNTGGGDVEMVPGWWAD